MKQSQTFKFDPKLIKALKSEAKKNNRPFNNYVETILFDRHKRLNPVVTVNEIKMSQKRLTGIEKSLVD